MKKRQKAKRLVALLLTVMMIFQQTNIITFAEEEVAEPTPTVTAAEPTETPESTQPEATEPTKAPAPQEPTATVAPTENPAPQDPAENEEPAVSPAPQDPAENEEPTVSPTPQDPAETQEPTATPAAEEPTETPEEAVTPTPEETVTPTPELTVTPTPEPPKTEFTCQSGNVIVRATATKAANLPQDAQLHADYMTPGSAAYESALAAMKAASGSEILDCVLYDIYFTSAKAGGRIEPENGTVTVTMQFVTPVLDVPEDVKVEAYDVLHVDNSGVVENVTNNVSTTGDGSVASAGFTSDSFSPFGVVLKGQRVAPAVKIPASNSLQDVTAGGSLSISEEEYVGVSRDGSFEINVSYELADEMIQGAAESIPWVYDLTAFIEQYPELKELISGNGNIMCGNSTCGTYKISNNQVTLTPDADWLKDQTEDVTGTFNFSVQLDKTKVGTKSESEFQFPGISTPIKVTYENVKIETSKSVNNGATGDIYIEEEDDGYKLNYTVSIKPGSDLTSLVLTDTISGKQVLDENSIKLFTYSEDNIKIPVGAVTKTNDGFTLDLAMAVNGTVKADTDYFVTYTTKVSEMDLNTEETNSASWTWNGDNVVSGGSTSVTPHKKLTGVKKEFTKEEKDGYTEYTYRITLGDENTNLAGHKITDTMTNNQKLTSDIAITPSVGETSTLSSKLSYGDGYVFNNNEVTVFEYTFPKDGTYNGPYTITYKTTTEGVTGISGENWVKNKVTDEHEGGKGEDSTGEKYNFGVEEKDAELEKHFDHWDAENQQVYWTIDVAIAAEAEKPLKNVVVTETELLCSYNWLNKESAEVNWDTVEIKAGNRTLQKGEDYTIDSTAKTITFAELSDSVTIILATKSPITIENKNGNTFIAENKASLSVNGEYINESYDYEEYVSSDIEMSKKGSYNKDTQMFTWTVVINPSAKEFSEDIPLYFSDQLPEGHEFVGGCENENASDTRSGTIFVKYNYHPSGYVPVTVSGGTILNTFIGELDEYSSAMLSGTAVTVCYRTKLTKEESQNTQGTTKQYKNVAYFNDAAGNQLASAEADVERTYEYVTKVDKGVNNDQITYEVTVNPDGLDLDPNNSVVTLTDTIPNGVELVTNSVKVLGSDGNALDEVHVSYAQRVLSITLPDATKALVRFMVTAQDLGKQQFKNEVILKGAAEYHSSTDVWHEIKQHSATIGGTKNSITLNKIDADNLTQPLEGAEFELYEVNEDNATKRDTTYKSNSKGVVTFSSLKSNTLYYWKEIKAPEGYSIGNSDNRYFIMYNVAKKADQSEDQEKTAQNKKAAEELAQSLEAEKNISINVVKDGYSWIVSNKKQEEKASLTITKTFGENTPLEKTEKDAVSFTVTGPKGFNETFTYKDMNDGSKTFDNLESGTYTVTETNAGKNGYTLSTVYKVNGTESTQASVVLQAKDTAKIELVNTYTPETVTVSGTKTWDDNNNQDGKRPESITINLYANGVLRERKTVTEEDSWSWSFADLDKYANGTEIKYTITEDSVPDYSSNVEGYNVTNTYTPGKTSKTVTKIWKDSDNQDGKRPESISVQLLADGDAKGEPVPLNEANGWTYIWNDLDEKANGKVIVYTVKEIDKVEGYTTSYSKDTFTITNTHTPETVEVSGSKTWKDENNQDGKRPKSITVKVMNGTTVAGTATVTPDADGNWNWKVENLPKYEDGKEIKYTVEEVKVEGYKTEITGNAKEGFTITNTYTPETTKVEGSKTWEDENNQDGKRPESITIKLYANGTFKESKTVTAEDNWSWSFADLAKYANGTEIKYTITEDSVPDYSSNVEGYNVTNTYTPGKTSKTVTKIWKDSDNQDGKRPEIIRVQLLADGDVKGEPVTLNEANNWTYTWYGLDEKADGKVIVYTVKEISQVEGYTTSYSEDTFTITNTYTYTPETVEVSGTKKWVNADGVEKPEVTIVLYRNNKEFDKQKLVNDAYSFKNLDKYDENGKEYAYRVEEVMTGDLADSFTGSQDGNNFTNTYKANPATAKIEGTKVYEHGLAADQFEFVLTQVDENGKTVKEIGTAKNKADGTFAFEEMKYDAEGTYYYQVTEKNAGKTIDGVTYDDEVITVEVKVTDNKEGSLVAAVSKKAADVKFTNTYSANGSIALTAAKNLTTTETPIQDGQFEFTLTGNDVSQKKSNVGNTVTFDAISYDESDIGKTYTYTVEEIDKKAPGYTYDKTKYTVSVEVKDNGDGTLKAVPTYTSSATNGNVAGMVFNNTYKAEGQIILTASKKLTGRTLEKDQFAFNITEVDENGQALAEGYKETAKNDASGTVTFPVISYTKSGTYYYQITEQNEKADGYTYDGSVYTVVVKAGNDKAGKLSAEIIEISKDGEKLTDENAAVVFSNEYKASGSLILKAAKSMKRQETKLGTFAFELKDADGKVIETVSNNEKGEISFSELTYDQEDIGKTYTYTVSEKVPAVEEQSAAEDAKYVYDETIYAVTVEAADNGDGTLKLTAKVDGEDYTDTAMQFVNDITIITVDKVDDEGNGIANAELQVVVKDNEGKVVEKWTSDGTSHDITGKLIAGETYTLEETSAPKGYAAAEPVEFTVEKSGAITIAGKAVDKVTMVDAKLHFHVNKTDLGNGEEVAGAELTVIDKETGKEIDKWVSEIGKTHDFGDKLEAGKEYILKETVAPDGYAYTTDIEFKVNKDGTIDAEAPTTTDENGSTVYLVKDAKLTFIVNKVDLGNGEEVEGAELTVIDKETGETVDKWVSEIGKTHDFGDKLEAGKDYILRETVAPDGYKYTTDISFSVGEDGSITADINPATDENGNTVYLVEDAPVEAEISKVDATTGEDLEGAVLRITDKDGEVVEEWTTDGKGSHLIRAKLSLGETYTLEEIKAPKNYDLAEPITFTVSEDGEVDPIVMEDARIEGASITVTKRLTMDGDPMSAADQTFYVGLYLDEACTQIAGDIKPIVFRNAAASSVTFGGLEVGRTYYVGECDADGNVLEVGTVESGDTFFANFADGNEAVVEEEDGSVTVFFDNEFMTIPDGFYVGGKLEITKTVVDVDGEETESDETFYAGIFDDEAYTIPSTKVGANLLALEMNGGSSTTVETTVNIPEAGGEVTLYVTEVDENGVPVADSKEFEYTVSQDVTIVTIDEENTYASVEIINSEIEEEEEKETPTPTPTSAPEKKKGVKTGDNTPIGMYLALIAASLVLIGTTGYRKRRRNNK